MNSRRNITVAFTGHRTYCGEANSDLRQTILRLCEEGFTRFLCGMAWGFDLAAGEAVAEAKKHCSEIELVAVVPYDGFGELFRGDDAEQYGRVMAAADEVVVKRFKNESKAESMLKHNNIVVEG